MLEALFDHAVAKLRAARQAPALPCKVCSGEARPFGMVDFHKSCDPALYPLQPSAIPVLYRLCERCRFLFTDFGDEFTGEEWRTYVYNDEYARVDPDYQSTRPRHNSREIISVLAGRKSGIVGLDYGGGNGRTMRLLREQGWNFDAYDPFGYTEMAPEHVGHYNFCSAIEVFEHTPRPVESLQAILALASPGPLILLIGTSIHDGVVSQQSGLSWWYVAPRNGHISIFSRRSLEVLGEQFGLAYASSGGRGGPHLLYRDMSRSKALALLLRGKTLRRARTKLKLWPGSLA